MQNIDSRRGQTALDYLLILVAVIAIVVVVVVSVRTNVLGSSTEQAGETSTSIAGALGQLAVTPPPLICGDGQKNRPTEECDEGINNGADKKCTTDCKLTYCGDGTKQQPNGKGTGGSPPGFVEACDVPKACENGKTCITDSNCVYSDSTPIGDGLCIPRADTIDGCSNTCQWVGTPISACGNLGSASTTYLLTADISNYPSGTCFTFGANRVTLNCLGHKIDGTDVQSSSGITVSSRSGATIKNCEVTDFGTGINAVSLLSVAPSTSISFVDIHSNTANGVNITGSGAFAAQISITRSTVSANSGNGVYIYNSLYTNLKNNIINGNGKNGVQIRSGPRLITNNVIGGASGQGNTISGNGDSYDLRLCSQSPFFDVTLTTTSYNTLTASAGNHMAKCATDCTAASNTFTSNSPNNNNPAVSGSCPA